MELHLALDGELHKCSVDPSQMEQVICNLVINARDAMPTGGELTLETRNGVLDRDGVAEHPEAVPGRYVVLSVTDNGTGMDSETQAHIFEPFFTTKPQDRGTGLGLATVYGIVKQSNGFIRVESKVGVGTTFEIHIAQAEGEAAPPPAKGPPPASLRGHETILVVEDDASLRHVVHQVLSIHGYTVLCAANGGEALLLCKQHAGDIQLLLTDVVMPRMSGRQLAEHLRALRPDMSVLYMSGHTEDAIVHHGVLDPDVAFIQKPLSPQALLSRVREVLDAAGRHNLG